MRLHSLAVIAFQLLITSISGGHWTGGVGARAFFSGSLALTEVDRDGSRRHEISGSGRLGRTETRRHISAYRARQTIGDTMFNT